MNNADKHCACIEDRIENDDDGDRGCHCGHDNTAADECRADFEEVTNEL